MPEGVQINRGSGGAVGVSGRGARLRKPARHAASDAALTSLISERLKTLRRKASLSLESLSRVSGVSRGMLSQIELGRSVPSVTVLSRIAEAFGLSIAAFLSRDAQAKVDVVRADSSQELRSPDGAFVSRALFPFRAPRRTEFYELRMQPGCAHVSNGHGAGTIENLAVASGEVTITVEESHQVLRRGDAIEFAADIPHTYQNSGTVTAVAYLVMIYLEPVTY